MPNNLPASIFYTIAAYDLKQPKPLLFRKANRVADLQKLLDLALHRGAVAITILRIHPPPAAKAHLKSPSENAIQPGRPKGITS